jgi:hypothetical protein
MTIVPNSSGANPAITPGMPIYQPPAVSNTTQIDANTQVERRESPSATVVTVTTKSARELPTEPAKVTKEGNETIQKEHPKSAEREVAKDKELKKVGENERTANPDVVIEVKSLEAPQTSDNPRLTKLTSNTEQRMVDLPASSLVNERTEVLRGEPLRVDPKVDKANEVEQRRNDLNAARSRLDDQLEVIRQVISNEISHQTTQISTARDPLTPDTQANLYNSDRAPNTAVALERLRESVLEKIAVIEERIETSSAIRQSQQGSQVEAQAPIQGRLESSTQEPIRHDRQPITSVQRADRAEQGQSERATTNTPLNRPEKAVQSEQIAQVANPHHPRHTREPLIGKLGNLSHNPASELRKSAERFDPRGRDALENLIDLLKNLSQRSTNFKLLRAMDTPLESVCLSLATGVAIGVVGAEYLIKVLFTSLTEAGMVVDISGVVVSKRTQEPLANLEVSEPRLGSRVTNSQGRFIFHNVAINTPYTLTIIQPELNLPSVTVSGTATPGGVIRIEV